MSERSPTGAPWVPAHDTDPDCAICPDCLPLVRRMEDRLAELDSQLREHRASGDAITRDLSQDSRLMAAWLEVLHWATETRTHCIRVHGGGPW